MPIKYVRMFRTLSSERVLLQHEGKDIGAVDLHYLEGGRVFATLILLAEDTTTGHLVEQLVEEIDNLLLPDVSRHEGEVVFTVIKGEIIGSYRGSV